MSTTLATIIALSKGLPSTDTTTDIPSHIAPQELQRKLEKYVAKHIGDEYWKLGLTGLNIAKATEIWETRGLQGLVEWHPQLVQRLAQKWVKKAKEKKLAIENFGDLSLHRRAKYLPTPTLRYKMSEDGKKFHWRFDPMLEPAGLLAEYLAYRESLPAGVPVTIRLLNEAVEVKNGKKTYKVIDPEEWAVLREAGFLPTKGRLAFFWDAKVAAVMKEWSGDDAIVLNSYAQRLGAALVPGGYIPRIKVGFSKARISETGKPLFVWDEGYMDGTPDGADGSHFYNADTLSVGDWKSIQFSVLGDEKVAFGKGIADPICGERCNGFDLIMDPDQIKGGYKGAFSDGDSLVMDIGALRVFQGGEYPLGFEQLQFMNPDLHPMGKETFVDNLVELMEEFKGRMLKKGVWGLLESLSEESPAISLSMQMLQAIDPEMTINPLSIDVLNDALDEALKSQLWQFSQGAGIRGAQLEIKIDATLKPGECVAYGFKPGQEVACWRFPTVLPQGLRTLKCMPRGERSLPVGRIYMAPFDVLAMQGDDDGDVVGLTADPRVVQMFGCRMTEKLFAIEPKGEKMKLPIESEAGLRYLETDPRGPVGVTTIWQAAIMACKNPKTMPYAISMALLNQYAIDSAKKAVIWPDVLALAEPSAWKLDEKSGFWKANPVPLIVNQEGIMQFPLLAQDRKSPCYAKQWGYIQKILGIKKEIVDDDGQKTTVDSKPLAWRMHFDKKGYELKKKVEFSTWARCRDKDDGFGGGNLVHAVHDKARLMIRASLVEMWNFDPLPVRELLIKALAKKGIVWQTQYSSFEEYSKGARKEIGVEWYGDRYSNIMKTYGPDERPSQIEMLNMEWENTISMNSMESLLEVWWWEHEPTWVKYAGKKRIFISTAEEGAWQANKPKHAWRVIQAPNNAILSILNLEQDSYCPWGKEYIIRKYPDVQSPIEMVVEEVLENEDPWALLNSKIHKNTHHGKVVRDEDGNTIELWQCSSCCRAITGMAMKKYRASTTLREQRFMKGLVHHVNNAIDRSIEKKEEKEFEMDDDWLEWMSGQV